MAKTNTGKLVISPIERCKDTIRQFAIDAILNPFDALVRPLKTVAKIGGVGVGATVLAVGGPDILQSTADRAEITIDIPGAAKPAYAEGCMINNDWYDPCPGTNPNPDPTPNPTPKPNPTPTPTPTPIPWESRDDDGDGKKNGGDVCAQTGSGEAVDANGCSANQRDDDVDGALGGVEVYLGSDPNNPNTDGDSLSDGQELYEADGVTLKTVLDADGDKRLDVSESDMDIDLDGKSPQTGDDDEANACVPDVSAAVCDQDADGLTLAEETAKGTDPTLADTDEDGVGDKTDKENKKLEEGETVDSNGVVIPVPVTDAPTPTEPVTEDTEPAETVPVGTDAESVTDSTEPGAIIVDDSGSGEAPSSPITYLVLGGIAVGIVTAGGIVILAKRRRDQENDVPTSSAPSRPAGGARHGVLHRSRTEL